MRYPSNPVAWRVAPGAAEEAALAAVAGALVTAYTIRHRIAIIVVLVAACFGMLALDSQGLIDPVRTGLRQAMTPIDRLSDGIIRTGQSDSELARENDALKRENAALTA